MYFIIIVLLFLAAVEDIRKMEISNVYPLLIFLFSIIRVVAEGLPLGFLILNTSLVFAVLYLFWHWKGIGGADVKILSALAVAEGIGVWVIMLIACVVFITYVLVLKKPKQSLPFVPAIFVGAVLEQFFDLGGYFG